VLIVPGAGVHGYARPAAAALRARGVDAELLPAPGSPAGPPDLSRYGAQLAERITTRGPVDLLVGLSVGAQAAALTAAALSPTQLRRLALVSPTVDPAARTARHLIGRWLAAGRREPPGLLAAQAPDWRSAGARRLVRVVRSALRIRIEDVAGRVAAEVTVVHGEDDAVTSHAYAAALAADLEGRLVVVPGATHSWPFGDAERFAATLAGLLK
jgi:fermentation-respiration switch protein FrsA (DUF1100 family)